jgi:hypothetical protein
MAVWKPLSGGEPAGWLAITPGGAMHQVLLEEELGDESY